MAAKTSETAKITAEEALAAAEAKATRAAELKAKRDDERAAREGETKADAFKRIAVRRMNNALDEITKLGPLAQTATYEYTDEQTAKIVAALRAGVDKVEKAFKDGGVRKDGGFDL